MWCGPWWSLAIARVREGVDVGMAAIGGAARWWVGGAVSVVMAASFLLLVRVPPVATLTVATPKQPLRSSVSLAPPDTPDALLKEEAELRDLRPMFLPTERNAALPEPRLEAGRTFLDSQRLQPSLP